MRRFWTVAAVILALALPAFAAKKIQGTTTLKDSQPTQAVPGKHQHQTFDLSFDAETNRYTCRTDPKKSMDATDFVVGGTISYEVDGQKVTIKTAQGKKVECKVVRVEVIPPAPATSTASPTQ